MTLKDFFKKYKITTAKFCHDCGISSGTLWNCVSSSKHRPSQRIALVIEMYTKGLVTVKELRGRDDRDPFNPDNTED